MNCNRQYQDVLLEYRGVKAYSTATHFQFMANRSVILEALQPDWDARLMSGPPLRLTRELMRWAMRDCPRRRGTCDTLGM